MQKKRLVTSDMELTPIGRWGVAMAAGDDFCLGPQDDDQSIAAIHEALDHGVTGSTPRRCMGWDIPKKWWRGRSRGEGARALRVHKMRTHLEPRIREIKGVLKADSIRKECENSLRRLQVDVIDLYQSTGRSPTRMWKEGWGALVKLQEEGKVRGSACRISTRASWSAAGRLPDHVAAPPYSAISPEIERGACCHIASSTGSAQSSIRLKSGLLTER